MPRLFVAIDIPDAIKSSLSDLCSFGLSGVKWVANDQFHLSLRFIGEVNTQTSEDIAAALFKIRATPFWLSLKSVGTFPQHKTPRVIWAGVPKNEKLNLLQKKVENQLNRFGIQKDHKKFSPHITLGRVKSQKSCRIGNFLEAYSLFTSQEFEVTQFHLYSSQLTPKGAVYRKEETYPLI